MFIAKHINNYSRQQQHQIMKLVTYAALAAPVVMGQKNKNKSPTESETKSQKTRIIGLLASLAEEIEDDNDRGFGGGPTLAAGWADSMVHSIDGYACWCYFEDDHGKGKGPSQNAVDAQCKILHDGYTCIFMDSEEEGEDCVPWEENYIEPTGLGWWSKTGDDEGMKLALRKECMKKNKKKSTCAQRSCIVEGYFSINLFILLTSGVKYDPKLLHSRNKFDPKQECQIKINQQTAEKQCCGQYPIRFPYKYLPGRRECCGGHTYNAEFLMCCDDSDVKLTCF